MEKKKKITQHVRRETIIDAAELLFSQGYDYLTMDKVAEIANISKGAIYLHFKSKDEMCMAIVCRVLVLIKKRFTEINQSEESGLLKIRQLKESYTGFQSEFPVYFQVLQKFRFQSNNCGTSSEELTDIVRENNNINEIIRQIIEQGKLDNSIREDLDEGKFALLLWGQFSGVLPAYIADSRLLRDFNHAESTEIFNYLWELLEQQISVKTTTAS